MTTWQHSAPFNQTNQTRQHNSLQVEDSPSDPLALLVEETLEFQAEYPQEVEEEVEEVEGAEEEVSLLRYQHNKQPQHKETSSSVIHRSFSQEIEPNQRRL